MSGSRTARWLTGAAVVSFAAFFSAVASAETLTADQAVQRAAAQNPSLRAALLDVDAAALAVKAEENARVPTFIGGVSGEYNESIGSADRSDSEAIRGNAGVQFKTDIGTTIETGVQSDVVWRNLTGTVPSPSTNPTYSTSAYVKARQPLLRGGGSDVVLAPLAQAESSKTQTEKQQELEASQTALDVLNAYWELWYADRAIDVQERSLGVAKKQVSDAKLKMDELGTGSKVDVLQFSSSLASIQDSLAQAKTTRSTRAIALGRLLGMSPDDSLDLETTEELPALGAAPSSKELRKTLTARSQELASLRAQLDSADTRVLIADDANQARIDLYGSASVGAVWASGDSYSGFDMPGGRPAFAVMAGLEFEVPLGESSATSEAARARTQRDATKARYQARVEAIEAEVASLEVELDAAQSQVDLASTTTDIAGELAEAERARLALGTTTSLAVVQAEQSLREAELRRLRALASQVITQFEIEHSAGALLDRYGSAFAKKRSS
ncbi:MAG: TolC family protein [Polyangiaceae bacterium]|nr:TolC family protein [Polyangiaceae bacterium]